MDQSWSEKMKDAWWAVRKNRAARILAIVIVSLAAVVGILYGVLAYYGRLPGGTDSTDPNTTTTPTDSTIVDLSGTTTRQLDGMTVDVMQSDRFPIAVMVENLVDIRPQAGLSSAGLVYEALVEGGITRFMAVYSTDDLIEKIGPIRSARHYFVDWAEEYGGIYAYVGGSPQALGVTGSSDYITDLNQFYNSEYYYRTADAVAPHNLFSSAELFGYALRDLELADTTGSYTAYKFKSSADVTERPGAVAPMTINYSNSDYQVEWRYDEGTNQYLRWNGGVEHLDANTSEQLVASNVVIQRVDTTVLEAATGRLDMETIGSGEAILFQDGAATLGSWTKSTRGDRTLFFNAAGEELAFNPGPTWIQIVPIEAAVTY